MAASGHRAEALAVDATGSEAEMYCTACGSQLSPGTRYCSECGEAIDGAGGARSASAPGTPSDSVARPAGPGAAGPALARRSLELHLDLRRLSVADWVVGAAGAVVAISLFLPWYDVPGYGYSSVSALGAPAGGFRFLVLVVSVVLALGALAVSLLPAKQVVAVPREMVLAAGAGVELILVMSAFLAAPEGLTTSGAGAVLGLLAAVMAAVAAGRAWAPAALTLSPRGAQAGSDPSVPPPVSASAATWPSGAPTAVPTAPSTTGRTCAACGAPATDAGQRFCTVCGGTLG